MKFSEYLLVTENRAEELSWMGAEQLLKKCQYAVNSKLAIYRGMATESEETYFFGDGKFDIPRRSAHTSNYSTLIIDNTPAWSTFPKRSKSYICTTDPEYASDHGVVYEVYPFDGANIGICSDSDFWYSFHKLQSITIDDINAFNKMIQNTLYHHFNKAPRNDTTFENIQHGCAAVDEYLKSINYDYRQLPPYELESRERQALEKLTKNHTPFLTGIMNILDPITNGFKQTTINNIKSLPSRREVWTDAPCVFKKYQKKKTSMWGFGK